MQVGDWLRQAEKNLSEAGVSTSRLDALVLLEDAMGVGRAKLLAEPGLEIGPTHLKELQKLLTRRARHEPLAYLRGQTEFYGRSFVVTQDVLEPRPESETIISLLKSLPGLPAKPRIVDVGTGSGALGITAKLELAGASVELVDIDDQALATARTNVDLFTLDISIIKSDLLSSLQPPYDVLLCNLPYVPDSHPINKAAAHEPRLAIFGGRDGLDLYRELFLQLAHQSTQVLYILCESLPSQHEALHQIAEANGYCLHQAEDFIQVFRPVRPTS